MLALGFCATRMHSLPNVMARRSALTQSVSFVAPARTTPDLHTTVVKGRLRSRLDPHCGS
jgi:hypothetical protein